MDFIKRTDAFQRVKKELTSGWAAGGLLSIAGSIFIFFLIISEFSNYLAVRTLSEVQMSANGDAQVKININISLPKLPCQFASLDVKDVIGTNKMNITTNIRKWKLSSHGKERNAEMNENQIAPKHDDEDKHPEDPVDKAQMLNNNNFKSYIESNDLVLVNFYAPWCHWSRRLMPTWHNTASVVSKKPYGYTTKIAMVDCTHADSVQTCRNSHINAFPMVAVFRRDTNTHEFYHGDRTTEAFVKFIENMNSKKNHDEIHKALGHKGNNDGDAFKIRKRGPEGCLISGFVMVNKVPGSLSIAAHSKHHTIAAPLINTTHKIHHFSFGDVPPKRSYGILKGAYDAANKYVVTDTLLFFYLTL
jgi:thiol-disulfide isomerase/thioredoxin